MEQLRYHAKPPNCLEKLTLNIKLAEVDVDQWERTPLYHTKLYMCVDQDHTLSISEKDQRLRNPTCTQVKVSIPHSQLHE
tara:strand:+ start:408 stop:647 length:240 start_codon:yes stop_codon:yes gene_type:complete